MSSSLNVLVGVSSEGDVIDCPNSRSALTWRAHLTLRWAAVAFDS